jgi:hypothetical protein
MGGFSHQLRKRLPEVFQSPGRKGILFGFDYMADLTMIVQGEES